MYQIGAQQIWCGDSLVELQHIPDESIDLIITSPPYADRRKTIYGEWLRNSTWIGFYPLVWSS